MAYTALYRKWRPRDFRDIIGQEAIVRTLVNQIMSDRLTHAYLFCGTRGTGKTSTAKVFAQAINCETPIDGNPCHKCASCLDIEEKNSMNIIEIDAASNNGVDNIREIREEVRYTPTLGKYKVYIIDEVHMLSIGAFNALLKTLEEPPGHVIFILATTEPHKILATILSRCQRYDFKRITIYTIAKALKSYMMDENIEIEDKALNYIGKVADGSMRDALSILDQCIAFYLGEPITLEKVLDVLGAVDHSVFAKLVDALVAKDAKTCMTIVDDISLQGRDILQFILDTVAHLRNLLIVKSVKVSEGILDMTADQIIILREQSSKFQDEMILYYIKQLSTLESNIKYMSGERILLEVELLKLCHPEMDDSIDGLQHRIAHLEEEIKKGVREIIIEEPKTEIKHTKKRKQKRVNLLAVPEDIKIVIENWEEVISRFDASMKAFISKTYPINLENDQLYIICEDETTKNYLSQEKNIGKINKGLEDLYNKKFNLNIIDQEGYGNITHQKLSKLDSIEESKKIYQQIRDKINFDVEIK